MEAAVDAALANGFRTGDLRGRDPAAAAGTTPVGTAGMGDAILAEIAAAP